MDFSAIPLRPISPLGPMISVIFETSQTLSKLLELYMNLTRGGGGAHSFDNHCVSFFQLTISNSCDTDNVTWRYNECYIYVISKAGFLNSSGAQVCM